MDRIDRKILNLMQRDASRTNADMAEEVGLSPSTCLRRVQRLKTTGVIDRIVAILNPARAGRGEHSGSPSGVPPALKGARQCA